MAVQISGNDITVPRDGTFSRNVSIAGTLTYEDVTNVDSIGLVTARNGIEVGASPGVAASISVDGNMIVSGISTFGGDVQVPDKIIHAGDTDTAIRFSGADTITAETGGTKRLEITSDGKYYFTGTGGGSGSRGLEIDTESVGAADEGVILNARASGTTGKIKLQTNSATAVTVEGNGGNVNVASNLKVAGVCTATSFSGDGSNLTGVAAISVAQQFRLAADQTGSSSAGTVLTNWEESDTDYQRIGSTVWSQSSGVFSCSVTGIYLCQWTLVVNNTSTGDAYDPNIQISTDSGSSYSTRSRSWAHIANGYVNRASPQNQFLFDVSNTSTFRLRYRQSEDNDVASGTTIAGSSVENMTNILFIRLGDT